MLQRLSVNQGARAIKIMSVVTVQMSLKLLYTVVKLDPSLKLFSKSQYGEGRGLVITV